jgi:hypothetical protein
MLVPGGTQRRENEGLAKTVVFHCGYLSGFIVITGKFSRPARNSWLAPGVQQLNAVPISFIPW